VPSRRRRLEFRFLGLRRMKSACSQLTLLLIRLVWAVAVTTERLAGLVLLALNQASGHSVVRSRSLLRLDWHLS